MNTTPTQDAPGPGPVPEPAPSTRDPLSHAVLGAAFEVAKVLGPGFLEAVYRRAMVRELERRGIAVRHEVRYVIRYKGDEVGEYIADLLIEDLLIVELKCVEAFTNAHVAQTLNYLAAAKLTTGLLLNFGRRHVEYKRLIL